MAHFTCDCDIAATLLDDAVHRGQAKARALALVLGGEKWLKDARPCLFVHAAARVSHHELDIEPRL